jgi:hypothetical protein
MSKQISAVEWLEKICNERGYYLMSEYFEQAKEMQREQMIEFACKVAQVSAEKYIQGKTTLQIAEELLTFKSE